MKLSKSSFFMACLLSITMSISTFSSCNPKKPKGKLTAFGAEPSVVCLNIGVPIVRVSFTAQSSSQQCVTIFVNGQRIVSSDPSPIPTLNNIDHCGTNEWRNTYSFSLAQLYGTNVPESITIKGELAKTGPYRVLDTRETAITTRVNCTADTIPQ